MSVVILFEDPYMLNYFWPNLIHISWKLCNFGVEIDFIHNLLAREFMIKSKNPQQSVREAQMPQRVFLSFDSNQNSWLQS